MGCRWTQWWIMLFLVTQLPSNCKLTEFGTRLKPPNKRWLLIGEDLNNAKLLQKPWTAPKLPPPGAAVNINPKPVPLNNDTKKLSTSQDNSLTKTDPDIRRYDLPKKSQNLHFHRIEPFWPFSNISTLHLANGFPKDAGLFFGNLPERFKDSTFFFSQIGPNSFEYRAQFHHTKNDIEPKLFQPFVNQYPEFPKVTFPPFPTFPEPRDIFRTNPERPVVPYPLGPQTNALDNEPFKDPFKNFDLVFNKIGGGGGGGQYPKIFRFNEERINIQDFEKEKKLRLKLGRGRDVLDDVRRNHLLILHGGIFTVKEPPLFNRKVLRKRRQRFRDFNRIINN